MKTNITTDNYEAYLLDYMEGNLNADETKQLKAFVATQGLDWNELTADRSPALFGSATRRLQ